MHSQFPYPEYSGVQNIGLNILLSLLTLGIFGLYWQYKQMSILNAWLGTNQYSFWRWFFLTIITCGIYEIYEEYKMAESINWVYYKYNSMCSETYP